MTRLRKFWFRFEKHPRPTAINLGCGVTAYDYNDAIVVLRERVFGPNGPPEILELIEDIEVEALEKNHVLPNLGNFETRGVWFPRGYETSIEARKQEQES